jgi:hypothetical protein
VLNSFNVTDFASIAKISKQVPSTHRVFISTHRILAIKEAKHKIFS